MCDENIKGMKICKGSEQNEVNNGSGDRNKICCGRMSVMNKLSMGEIKTRFAKEAVKERKYVYIHCILQSVLKIYEIK